MAEDKSIGPQHRHTDARTLPTHHPEPPGRGVDPGPGRPDAPRTSNTRPSRAAAAKRHAQARAYLEQVDALTARISALWNDNVSAVDAIREQRRDL